MSKSPSGHGDLTADLLADLERDAVVTSLPRRSDAGAARGSGLQSTLRITPRSWRRPGLRLRTGRAEDTGDIGDTVGRFALDLSFGPVSLDLSL